MAKYLESQRDAHLFVKGNLESLLPADSMARGIWQLLEGMDFSQWDAVYRNDETGRPAIDPKALTGVWLLGFVRRENSSVALARLCNEDIEFRWMLGDTPVEKSTLCAFRKEHSERLAELSSQVLMAMVSSGLLMGEAVGVDGTMVRAAASKRSNRSHKELKRELERLTRRIERSWEADEEQQEACGDSELRQRERERERCQRRKQRVQEALEFVEGLKEEDRITVTEPQAPLRKMKDGAYHPGHNIQMVSDLDSGAIVHAEVVDAGNDQGQLESQVRQAAQKLQEAIQAAGKEVEQGKMGPMKAVVADAAYHDTVQLAKLQEEGLEVFVPDDQKANRKPTGVSEEFWAEAFRYDAPTDTMICPCGEVLKRWGLNTQKTSVKYRAKGNTCRGCEHKDSCCPQAKGGRTVSRSLFEQELNCVAQAVASEKGQTLLQGRWVALEGGIGRLKDGLNWQRCRMWGSAGARAEALWRQLTHNILLLMGAWKPLVHQPVAALQWETSG